MSKPFSYVELEDQDATTERYPAISQPPISTVRLCIRGDVDTLRSSQWPEPRRWPFTLVRAVACAVIAVLMLNYPWPPTVAIIVAMVTLIAFARRK